MLHKYTQGLIIDGITYNIPMVSIQRTLDFLEKYAERTEDGDIKIESIGLYKNYTISIGTIDDVEMYDKLIDHITDCENRFHHVSLPDASKQGTPMRLIFMGIFPLLKTKWKRYWTTGHSIKACLGK